MHFYNPSCWIPCSIVFLCKLAYYRVPVHQYDVNCGCASRFEILMAGVSGSIVPRFVAAWVKHVKIKLSGNTSNVLLPFEVGST